MQIEEEYQDVLQNIEFAIVQVYREDRTLLDSDVLESLEALQRYYQAQARQRSASVKNGRCPYFSTGIIFTGAPQ
jgi:hypothetical protein